MLTSSQREALTEAIKLARHSGNTIPWQEMLESSTFADVPYDALRREGEVIRRRLQLNENVQVHNKLKKRRIEEDNEEIGEAEDPVEDQERRLELETLAAYKAKVLAGCHEQIKEMTQQVSEFEAVEENERQLTEEEEEEETQSLYRCINILRGVIDSKDVMFSESHVRSMGGIKHLLDELEVTEASVK